MKKLVSTQGLLFGHYEDTALSDAIVFSVLIIVLLVRPTGLLGKPVREKV